MRWFIALLALAVLIPQVRCSVVCSEDELIMELRDDIADNGRLDCLRSICPPEGGETPADKAKRIAAQWDSDCSFEAEGSGPTDWFTKLKDNYGVSTLVDVDGKPVSKDFDEQADMCEIVRALIAAGKVRGLSADSMSSLDKELVTNAIDCAGEEGQTEVCAATSGALNQKSQWYILLDGKAIIASGEPIFKLENKQPTSFMEVSSSIRTIDPLSSDTFFVEVASGGKQQTSAPTEPAARTEEGCLMCQYVVQRLNKLLESYPLCGPDGAIFNADRTTQSSWSSVSSSSMSVSPFAQGVPGGFRPPSGEPYPAVPQPYIPLMYYTGAQPQQAGVSGGPSGQPQPQAPYMPGFPQPQPMVIVPAGQVQPSQQPATPSPAGPRSSTSTVSLNIGGGGAMPGQPGYVAPPGTTTTYMGTTIGTPYFRGAIKRVFGQLQASGLQETPLGIFLEEDQKTSNQTAAKAPEQPKPKPTVSAKPSASPVRASARTTSRFPEPEVKCMTRNLEMAVETVCKTEMSGEFYKYCLPIRSSMTPLVESFLFKDSETDTCKQLSMCA